MPRYPDEQLIHASACEIRELLLKKEISAHDLLDALENRIALVDNKVNALPTLCFERARTTVNELEKKPVTERGILGGIPVAIKDLTAVKGVRTTYGSPIFADEIPDHSDVLVETMEKNGAVIYAKSNTPEFGAGAHTFNPVFGTTCNPWDLTKSAAGSSGGAAAALASGTAWLAHGSDMGGSLRNPASFCGVVGLRPSLHLVASGPSPTPFQTLSMQGPMARNVEDTALLLDAMVGSHPTSPLALDAPGERFLATSRKKTPPKKIAFSPDLGVSPVDPEILDICKTAALHFQEAGVIVEESCPDLSEAPEVFRRLRGLDFLVGLGPLQEEHPGKLKEDIILNIEYGRNLSAEDIAWAERKRGEIYHRMQSFFGEYDLLLCPATIVPPFPIEQRYVSECAGQKFESYIDWLALVSSITITASPALSLPCGFTSAGLPVGLQLVGRPRADAELLSAANLLEEILPKTPTPILPKTF
ncbi:amidase family protein [Kiloniella laminariae]|uniref:Amidase family protein n=1 Tax=Kiloniella laminariae TaxID=454162 RepID=A0ABT4LHH6_9PROT|nr:amidase family protein [Kiloniella laminariae]MCZ4280549.1 amidase family protein [Kiloniella laminariae]